MAEMRMAYDPSIDTDDSAVPAAVRRFLRNRLFEFAGGGLFAALIAIGVALATWSVDDPSLNHAVDAVPRNWLGYPGAVIADEMMQLLGLGVLWLIAIPMAWAVRLIGHDAVTRPFRASFAWIAASFSASGAFAAIPVPASWSLAAGLGGNAGDILNGALVAVLALGLKAAFAKTVAGFAFAALALWIGLQATRLHRTAAIASAGYIGTRCNELAAAILRAMRHLYAGWRGWRERRRLEAANHKSEARGDILMRLAPARSGGLYRNRIEPLLDSRARQFEPPLEGAEQVDNDAEDEEVEAEADEEVPGEDDDDTVTPRVSRTAKPIKTGKRFRKDTQLGFRFTKPEEFELPPLTLLSEPKRLNRGADLSDEALEQNTHMLEGVLEDFGVKGQIVNVWPGPVVTLYELEPAPGIKSSRVIGLADDIARSMSAVAARVAVVPGRNAIGIELPNSKRETVYLRELLASEAFEKTGQNLALALGKNIGGEPIFADLSRMPHLLIAGTTGSGKSVGINTMILSLIYRLPPDRCKLIMIDPKMLELSVYEGIPHLLSPVVTDPRKAIVALKWAVREMEDRYRKMSKLGVRNIDGYNARVKQALAKGVVMTRTVQTGFDPETGEPIFERQQMDMAPIPYIVVIIDEMADLMMVAGKDIEGAVQRLAQMARAAGIHVIMATQRPSVDVITGTIKANFPTRISFQVTSKIDSRTILGEQGAEQLLGQGDMLYMAGGGRISRLHGPFVSDSEVEKIVDHLKSQGSPKYVDAVTEETEDGNYGESSALTGGENGGPGDELYDQAVAVVLRDKKVSTSYVQRRLQVGYNKAASLIERMEKEGLISAANATGKREILVPGDNARV
ncbi:MAG: DNA translocase FtsK [Hyphomicrobiales bacterium]